MAKKKVEVEADEVKTEQIDNVEGVDEPQTETVDEIAQPEATEVPEEVKPAKKSKSSKAETEIPAKTKDLLKVFKRYPELLITKDGGVFTPDTKLPEHKGAILYKNPFYNN